MKSKPASRNPIAKAVRHIKPKVITDKRKQLIEKQKRKEIEKVK